MPTWGELLRELKQTPSSPEGASPFDIVRRKYLTELHDYTKRNVILYSTNWLTGLSPAQLVNISEEDIEAFMEVVHGLDGDGLDLILHTPGGSAEATEALVKYLRKEFTDIRVIIPHAAMSAGTMLSCAANRIMMGDHSFIGPIDPIFILNSQPTPAQAILEQFALAKKECQDPKLLGTWLPILTQYGPGLLVQCENATDLSKSLVSEWLAKYMFAGKRGAKRDAARIANFLSSHRNFKSHARHLGKDDAKKLGLTVEDLEADEKLQDLVLSVYHMCSHTFSATGVAKIVENHMGKAFIKMGRTQVAGPLVLGPLPIPHQPAPPPMPQAPSEQPALAPVEPKQEKPSQDSKPPVI